MRGEYAEFILAGKTNRIGENVISLPTDLRLSHGQGHRISYVWKICVPSKVAKHMYCSNHRMLGRSRLLALVGKRDNKKRYL